jgi:PAS domain-containing protein
MSTPSTNLHAPQSRRATTFRQGAFKIAAIYLVFAALWIGLSETILSRVADKSRVLYLERLEDAAFVLCTGILLYVLVMRFARERAAIEHAVRRNERRYRSLVLATAQVTWTGAPNGEIIDPQPTWEAFTGQTFEQYKGFGWIDAVHPDDREHLMQRWRPTIGFTKSSTVSAGATANTGTLWPAPFRC